MDYELEINLPLDEDGYLRRQCPICGREFKWLNSDQDESGDVGIPSEYFCPYCGVPAPPDEWWTQEQLTLIEGTVMDQVVEPGLDGLREQMANLGKQSGGLISAELHVDRDETPVLEESDDMVRIDFGCHPHEPVKIVETWTEPIHCLSCGKLQHR